jgi:hypothetical protein
MAGVRAQYESQKAAAEARKQASKTASAGNKSQTANTAGKKSQQQTAGATATRRKHVTQTTEEDIPYRPRGAGTPVDNGGSDVGSFAAGALLGTALGVAIGKH